MVSESVCLDLFTALFEVRCISVSFFHFIDIMWDFRFKAIKFTGPECPLNVNGEECSGRGVCITDSGICQCEPGYIGPVCSLQGFIENSSVVSFPTVAAVHHTEKSHVAIVG